MPLSGAKKIGLGLFILACIAGIIVVVIIMRKKSKSRHHTTGCGKYSGSCKTASDCCDKSLSCVKNKCQISHTVLKPSNAFLMQKGESSKYLTVLAGGNIGMSDHPDVLKEFWSFNQGVLKHTTVNGDSRNGYSVGKIYTVSNPKGNVNNQAVKMLPWDLKTTKTAIITDSGVMASSDFKWCTTINKKLNHLEWVKCADLQNSLVFNIIKPTNCGKVGDSCSIDPECCSPFSTCLDGKCISCFIDEQEAAKCKGRGDNWTMVCDPKTQKTKCVTMCDVNGADKKVCENHDDCHECICLDDNGTFRWELQTKCEKGGIPGCEDEFHECKMVGTTCKWECSDPKRCTKDDGTSKKIPADICGSGCTYKEDGHWDCGADGWKSVSCVDDGKGGTEWKCDAIACDPSCKNDGTTPGKNCPKCSKCGPGEGNSYICDPSTGITTCKCIPFDKCSILDKPSAKQCSDAKCIEIQAFKCPDIYNGTTASKNDWKWICPSSQELSRCELIASKGWKASVVKCDPNSKAECEEIVENICKGQSDVKMCVGSFKRHGEIEVPIAFANDTPIYPTINGSKCASDPTFVAGDDAQGIIGNPPGNIMTTSDTRIFYPHNERNTYYDHEFDPPIKCMIPVDVMNNVCSGEKGNYIWKGADGKQNASNSYNVEITEDPIRGGRDYPNTDDLLKVGRCNCNDNYGGFTCTDGTNCKHCAYPPRTSQCQNNGVWKWNKGTSNDGKCVCKDGIVCDLEACKNSKKKPKNGCALEDNCHYPNQGVLTYTSPYPDENTDMYCACKGDWFGFQCEMNLNTINGDKSGNYLPEGQYEIYYYDEKTRKLNALNIEGSGNLIISPGHAGVFNYVVKGGQYMTNVNLHKTYNLNQSLSWNDPSDGKDKWMVSNYGRISASPDEFPLSKGDRINNIGHASGNIGKTLCSLCGNNYYNTDKCTDAQCSQGWTLYKDGTMTYKNTHPYRYKDQLIHISPKQKFVLAMHAPSGSKLARFAFKLVGPALPFYQESTQMANLHSV